MLMGGEIILLLEVYSRHMKKDVHTIMYIHRLMNISFIQYKTPSIHHLHMIHLHI